MSELRNPNAAESEAILVYLAAVSELVTYDDSLKRRLSEIPNGLQTMRRARTNLLNLIPKLMDTVPEGKRRYFLKMAKTMVIDVKNGAPRASKVDTEWALIHQKDLDAIVVAARDACLVCLDSNCNRCALGKALDNVLKDSREPGETWMDAWYRQSREAQE